MLRDRRFLAVSAGNAVLCLHFGLFEVAMPLWIVSHTQAPRWLVAALLLLNSALVVLLQVRVGRRAGDVRQAARLVRLAGFLLLASTAAFATTGDLDAVPASVVLLGAATVYVLGEVCHAAGGWALSYGLTDQELHGQYQGVFHAAEGIGIAVSPLVATGVVLQFAAPGWVAVGCLLAATGIVVARLSRRQDAAR